MKEINSLSLHNLKPIERRRRNSKDKLSAKNNEQPVFYSKLLFPRDHHDRHTKSIPSLLSQTDLNRVDSASNEVTSKETQCDILQYRLTPVLASTINIPSRAFFSPFIIEKNRRGKNSNESHDERSIRKYIYERDIGVQTYLFLSIGYETNNDLSTLSQSRKHLSCQTAGSQRAVQKFNFTQIWDLKLGAGQNDSEIALEDILYEASLVAEYSRNYVLLKTLSNFLQILNEKTLFALNSATIN